MTESTEIAQRDPVRELVSQVRSSQFEQQVELALPEGMNARRFGRVLVTALQANPDLAEKSDHSTLLQSALKAAADGLLPDNREAALVLFWNKEKRTNDVVYMPMIGGLRKIAAEYGWALRARVVFANDEFEYEEGVEPRLFHRPARPGADRGEPVAVYAIAKHRDGRQLDPVVLYAADVEKIRQTSRSKDRGPWVDWWERMWEKTAARQLFKQLPLDEKDRERIVRVLDASDLGPAESAALMYGPNARQAFEARELPPASPPPQPGGDGAGSTVAVAAGPATPREEAAADRTGDVEPAAAAPTEPEPEPEPTPQGADFQAPADVEKSPDVLAAELAAEIVIPNGANKGRPLKDLLEMGGDGTRWLTWALRHWADDAFGQACWAFAKVYAPDIHEKVAAEKGRLEA